MSELRIPRDAISRWSVYACMKSVRLSGCHLIWNKMYPPEEYLVSTRLKKGTLKLYLGVLLICLVVAAGMAFIPEKVAVTYRDMKNDVLKQIEKATGKKIDMATVEKFEKSYLETKDSSGVKGPKEKESSEKITGSDSLQALKKAYKEKLSEEEKQKIKEAYTDYNKRNP